MEDSDSFQIMRGVGLVVLLAVLTRGEVRIGLNSDRTDWSVHNSNKSVSINATVPGGIYTDLQKVGLISDNLFYRFNDIEYRWVGRDNWVYSTSFDLPFEVFNKTVVNIVLHGADTVATVHVNGFLTGFVQNMFVRYVIPVKEYIREVNNTLEVKFKSPIVESKNLYENHNYTVPPSCVPTYYNGECHVNFLRKMQASFAWDWGPAFPSMGLWKEVEIEAYDAAVLRDVTTNLEDFNETTWRLDATAYLDVAGEDIGSYEILGRVWTDEWVIDARTGQGTLENGQLVCVLQFMIPKNSVRIWWPNGFGDQPLYKMNITFRSKDKMEESSKKISVGIRMVELVQERIRPQKSGLTFFFRVNGIAIFAKGSNWIPSHILPELSYNEKRIRSLLTSCKDAHMNMLRVWGGGLYESDLFYKIADELGIMIWQDMMYACSMYPTNKEFLDSVTLETVQQVRRLQHHPSIVLWAGNNENEAALRGNWYGTSRNFELYKSDYVKLYVDTVRPAVLRNDDTRPFAVSSPSNGVMSEKEGHIANDPYSPLFGDIHFYNYILDSWDSNTYPYTRFASEYGFQSLPSFKTMSKVTKPNDRKIESQFSAKRQHLLAGYFFMALQMKMRLPLMNKTDEEDYYKTFIYYSQIAQAMGIKTETEKYRRDRNKLTKNNEGRTMGAMYWQLNDVWQAPTWSSIDFDGRWKMLHYYAKRFFSPVLVSLDLTIDNRLNVFIVSDLTQDIPQAQMNISVYSWDSFEPRKIITSEEYVRRGRSKLYARYDLGDLLREANCSTTDCFLHVTLTADTLSVDNTLFPISFSKITNLKPANISVEVTRTNDGRGITVELNTNEIAPFVWLETDEEGQFSDNGFIILGEKKTVDFANRNVTIDYEKFKKSLTVRSLLSRGN